MSTSVRQAAPADLSEATRLALLLWPDNEPEALSAELAALLERPDAALFLCEADGQAVGYAQCQLRRDYVEGCETSPVGYLEGVYVEAAHRREGVASALVGACQDWARAQGCREFASDCELDNTDSLRFHLGIGFEEAGRIICFTKKL